MSAHVTCTCAHVLLHFSNRLWENDDIPQSITSYFFFHCLLNTVIKEVAAKSYKIYLGNLHNQSSCGLMFLLHDIKALSDATFYDKHYDNRPMQYTAIFHGCKNDNSQMKNYDIFLIFAQNIDRVEAVLTRTHNLCFRAKNMTIMYTPVNPSFTI